MNEKSDKKKITDIVVSLNDFLIEPDTISGGLYVCQNGGMGLLAKSATKDKDYIMRKFFGYLDDISSKGNYTHEYYYENIRIPHILIDYLLNNDTDSNILKKVKEHINKKAKWMDRKGILAIADMTFHPKISKCYRKINNNNIELLKTMSNNFTIHILGNCNKFAIDSLIDDNIFESINGEIITSSDLKELKCGKSNKYDIYELFLHKCNIDPTTCLFIETHKGHIDAIEEYAKVKNIKISSILYDRNTDITDFYTKLSELLEIKIDMESN